MRRGKDGSKAREQKPRCGGSTHSFQDADGLLAEPDWVEHVIVEDGLKQVVLVVSLEGGLPGHHLIHQHPQGPPVHGGAILQLLQDLRSDVVRSPTERGGRHTIQNPFLAHPKVGQLAVTFCIQKDIVQFQIPATWARTTL